MGGRKGERLEMLWKTVDMRIGRENEGIEKRGRSDEKHYISCFSLAYAWLS